MNGIEPDPEVMIDVIVRLGRTHVLASSPTRLQVLVETRPNSRTSHTTAPTDIRLVVDVSGSMQEPAQAGAPSKLEVVKEAILKLLTQLNDRDSILLSVFSSDGRLVVPLTHLTSDSRQHVQQAILGLHPESTTNISFGLEIALQTMVARGTLPRVILFTDGMSSYPERDHPRLVRLADTARNQNIPLSIYGTGSDYNWSLLQQVAIRAGGGSFCKHVMDVATLEGHMLAELANLRGTAIDQFEIDGIVASGVTIISVKSMMPQIRELEIVNRRVFRDHTGALDLHRGAQYLVELEVNDPSQGQMTVLFITLRGRNRTTFEHFERMIEVPVSFVASATQESPVDEQVKRVLLMLAATKEAEAGAYEKAASLYRRGGDQTTAMVMDNLHTASLNQGANSVDLGREATSRAGDSISTSYTIGLATGRGKP